MNYVTRNSNRYSLASHHKDPGLTPGECIQGLLWTRWHWGRIFPKYSGFQHQCHCTNAPYSSSSQYHYHQKTKWANPGNLPHTRAHTHKTSFRYLRGMERKVFWPFFPSRPKKVNEEGQVTPTGTSEPFQLTLLVLQWTHTHARTQCFQFSWPWSQEHSLTERDATRSVSN
jgi:hypothetical protein